MDVSNQENVARLLSVINIINLTVILIIPFTLFYHRFLGYFLNGIFLFTKLRVTKVRL